jgi:AcrR family transcriptional regulator
MYPRRPAPGFGNQNTGPSGHKPRTKPRSKPLKRPRQARAKFTVQAIYDAFVRIWRAEGWDGVTTRAVALETGVSIGTLYEYFPNKEALLSGYFRHCIDALLEVIDEQAIRPTGLTWQERVHRLVRLTCGIEATELPYFDGWMLQLENQVAEPKHHRRVYEELSAKWAEVFAACGDLPYVPDPATAKALYLSVWGGRRYLLLIDADASLAKQWVHEVEQLCRARLEQTRAC